VVTRRIGTQTLLVPVVDRTADMGNIFTLNETGSLIWSRLQRSSDFASLVAALVEEYDTTTETAGTDGGNLLDALVVAGLARRALS
jgi:hypothetical protein